MRGKIAIVIAFAGLALAGENACAMTARGQAKPHCRVVGGEKLPAASGGSDALCAAIEQAASARVPGVTYSVEVRVLSSSMLSVGLTTADGRPLPEQNFAITDRDMTETSFRRFAETIAAELGKASPR
ncbi:MAG TPA: hypothetical protein VJ859_11640 [Allosphingosinicella sp.]|nr:hypothetical protein [Allosphingosinicella sp.]